MTKISTLSTYVFLRANCDKRKDYLDLFYPIIKHCLSRLQRGRPITRELLQDKLVEEFGLSIPLHCWELLMTRLKKIGDITSGPSKQYYISENFIDALLEDDIKKYDSEIGDIATRLSEFAASDGEKWSIEKSKSAIISFCHNFGLNIYINDVNISPNSKYSNEIKTVARYIQCEYKRCRDTHAKIINIVKGCFLSNALTFSNDTSMLSAFRNVEVYFDTSIVLNILGLGSPEECKATKELLSLFRSKNGTIKIFAHTRQEIMSIIDQCITEWDTPSFDGLPALYNAKINKIKYSDMVELAGSLDSMLNKLGIEAERTGFLGDDPAMLEDFMQKLREYGGYSVVGIRAAEKDAKSYINILKKRNTEDFDDIAYCKAILVTSNTHFAKTAAEFSTYKFNHTGISPVISDVSASIIVWLNSSLLIDLPESISISLSMAALMPSHEFWDNFVKLLDEAEKSGTVQPGVLKTFKVSPYVKRELANYTKGREIELSEDIIPELESILREEIVAEERLSYLKKEEVYVRELSQYEENAKKLEITLAIVESTGESNLDRAIKAEAKVAVKSAKTKIQPYRTAKKYIKVFLFLLLVMPHVYKLICLIPYFHGWPKLSWLPLLAVDSTVAAYVAAGRIYTKFTFNWLIAKLIPYPTNRLASR